MQCNLLLPLLVTYNKIFQLPERGSIETLLANLSLVTGTLVVTRGRGGRV